MIVWIAIVCCVSGFRMKREEDVGDMVEKLQNGSVFENLLIPIKKKKEKFLAINLSSESLSQKEKLKRI